MAYNVLNIMDLLKNICIDKDLVVQLLVGGGGLSKQDICNDVRRAL